MSFVGVVLPDHALFTGRSTYLFLFLRYLSLCTFLARRFVVFVLPCSVRTNIATTFIFYYVGSSTAIIFTHWLIWYIVVLSRHTFDACWDTAKYTTCLTYCCTSSRKSYITSSIVSSKIVKKRAKKNVQRLKPASKNSPLAKKRQEKQDMFKTVTFMAEPSTGGPANPAIETTKKSRSSFTCDNNVMHIW